MEDANQVKRILIFLLLGLFVGLLGFCKKDSGNGEAATEASASEEEVAEAKAPEGEVAEGKALFISNGCSGCHGETGMGDGPAGQALNPKPRNFRDTANYKQGSSVDEVQKTIASGVPGTAMVAFSHIPEDKRLLIAKYIVYLQSN